jgi:hypothetical protein
MDTVWASRLCTYIYCNVVVVLIVSVSCTSRSHPWTPVSTGLNQRVRFASDLCSETVSWWRRDGGPRTRDIARLGDKWRRVLAAAPS